MHQAPVLLARRPRVRAGSVLTLLAGIASFALLAYVIFGAAHQIITAPPPLRLLLVHDIPLPSGLGTSSVGTSDPLAPGVAVPFDRFDFQAYDAQTHKLFIAHSGPNPDRLTLAHIPFDPATDGHIIVFDTEQQRVIARVNIPHVTGIAVATDLHKVYASAANDNDVYAIDESTLVAKPIHLAENDSPDAISYDPDDHRIFVSDPGAPANPDKSANVDRENQNVVVIDAHSDRIVKKIKIGNMPRLPVEDVATVEGTDIPAFGYDIGHSKYDSVQHRVFLVTQILPDADSPNPNILPPPGTGELMAIDPVSAKVVRRVVLPASCITPHGMSLDTEQEVAFIACVEVNTATGLAPNLVRVDLKTMKVIPSDPQQMRLASTPDMVIVDHTYHVVLVGCRGGISVFDERPGAFHKLNDYQMGKNTHSIVLDEATQYLYLPLIIGGRPVLRVLRYNPTGA
ncbi:MAG: YncE family protein [Ktedonobacterales bacterium]